MSLSTRIWSSFHSTVLSRPRRSAARMPRSRSGRHPESERAHLEDPVAHLTVSSSRSASGTTLFTKPMSRACCASYCSQRYQIPPCFLLADQPRQEPCLVPSVEGTELLDGTRPHALSPGIRGQGEDLLQADEVGPPGLKEAWGPRSPSAARADRTRLRRLHQCVRRVGARRPGARIHHTSHMERLHHDVSRCAVQEPAVSYGERESSLRSDHARRVRGH